MPIVNPAFTPTGDLQETQGSSTSNAPHTVSKRWCRLVMLLVDSDQDLKTNEAWARHVGVSRSALSECCRLVHVAPHHARNFARMLRAVRRSGAAWKPETILDFADARTLKRLETYAGLTGERPQRTPTVEEFLERQQWIRRDNPVLLDIHLALGVEFCVRGHN